jgi:hypothetical protein
MHFIRAYIASVIILTSWCMHHLVNIMVIALCHMHHFGRAWDPLSSCCIIIAIIHLNRASHSWLYIYIEHCTLSRAFYHYPLIASASMSMFCNQYHVNHSGNKLWARMFQTSLISLFCYPYLLSIKFCDEYRWHLSSSCCDRNSMRTRSPFPLLSC